MYLGSEKNALQTVYIIYYLKLYVILRTWRYGASSNNCYHFTCDLNYARGLQKNTANKKNKTTTTMAIFTVWQLNLYNTNTNDTTFGDTMWSIRL